MVEEVVQYVFSFQTLCPTVSSLAGQWHGYAGPLLHLFLNGLLRTISLNVEL